MSVSQISESPSTGSPIAPTRVSRTRAVIGRAAEILLAFVFLLGAILKAADINLFAVQIAYYGVLYDPMWIGVAAVGTLWLETALGMALLLGLRAYRLTYFAVLLLLVVFTLLIAYGWYFHGLRDCGCFGPIEMSPGISIGKNGALALFAILAWLGTARPQRRFRTSFLLAVVAALAASSVSSYAGVRLEPASDKNRPYANFQFEADGVPWDLARGEYLVAVLSMTCEDCIASVAPLNELAVMPDLPPLVALCYEEKPGDLENFRSLTGPIFPLHSLGGQVRTFFDLIGQEPPRLALVLDGSVLQYWDINMPAPDEVVAAVNQRR